MNLDDYLIRQVQPYEFENLKSKENEILEETKNRINDFWRPKIKNIQVTFKYNKERKMLGIFLKTKKQEYLIINREELTKNEDTLIGSLYITLEQKLDRLRLINEKWLNSITE